MPAKKIDGDSSTSTSESRASNCSLLLRVNFGHACAPGMIGASAAIIWQPLQTPSANVSRRSKNAANGFGELRVEHDRARPALTGAERVAVAEAAAGDEALEHVEPRAAGLQVGHVHVEGVEAGLVHRVAQLDVAVDALLAQDGELGARRQVQRGRGDGVERASNVRCTMQAGVVGRAGRRVLGIRALRVVAQARDAPADLVPRLLQVAQRRAEDRLGVAPDLDHAAIVRLADDVAVPARPCSRSSAITLVAVARCAPG